MQVDYRGWKEGIGAFSCQIFVDENKTDYEIHYKNGMIARQISPFDYETNDWNHDGDIYTKFGAFFSCKDKKGNSCGVDFWSPEEMVRVVVDAKNTTLSRLNGNDVIDIPGIKIPDIRKHPPLDQQLRMTERRKEAMDIERNRKMKMLGVRPPNEPWVR